MARLKIDGKHFFQGQELTPPLVIYEEEIMRSKENYR